MTSEQMTAFASIASIASALFAALTWRAAKIIANGQYARSIEDVWNSINIACLSNEDALKAAASLEGNIKNLPTEQQRRAFMIFLYVNALQAAFLGKKYKMLDKNYTQAMIKDILHPILDDDTAYKIICNAGYHPEFVRYWEEYRSTRTADNKLLADLINN